MNGWLLPKKILNYKTEGRRNLDEMGRWFPVGRHKPRGLSLIDDDDDGDDDDDEVWRNKIRIR